MLDIIKRNLADIKRYCATHNLDFNKIVKSPCSLDEQNNVLSILYYDKEQGRLELEGKKPAEPCPCLLVIMEAPVGLLFEQTEFTKMYLSV